jgi:hypothetical protein
MIAIEGNKTLTVQCRIVVLVRIWICRHSSVSPKNFRPYRIINEVHKICIYRVFSNQVRVRIFWVGWFVIVYEMLKSFHVYMHWNKDANQFKQLNKSKNQLYKLMGPVWSGTLRPQRLLCFRCGRVVDPDSFLGLDFYYFVTDFFTFYLWRLMQIYLQKVISKKTFILLASC